MKAAELKTKRTNASVQEFVAAIADETQRADCQKLLKLMKQITGAKPKLWGDNMVGFGEYHYEYASGRAGDWFQLGFSPRKQGLAIYLTSGFAAHTELLARLGKHKIGKSCLTLKKLTDADADVLQEILTQGVANTTARK